MKHRILYKQYNAVGNLTCCTMKVEVTTSITHLPDDILSWIYSIPQIDFNFTSKGFELYIKEFTACKESSCSVKYGRKVVSAKAEKKLFQFLGTLNRKLCYYYRELATKAGENYGYYDELAYKQLNYIKTL